MKAFSIGTFQELLLTRHSRRLGVRSVGFLGYREDNRHNNEKILLCEWIVKGKISFVNGFVFKPILRIYACNPAFQRKITKTTLQGSTKWWGYPVAGSLKVLVKK